MNANLYPAAATFAQSIGAPPGWLCEDTSTPSASPAGTTVRAAPAAPRPPARPATIRSAIGECVAPTLLCQAGGVIADTGNGTCAETASGIGWDAPAAW